MGLALAAACVAGGCAGELAGSSADSVDVGARSPFAPKEMRIFPLTHLERVPGEGERTRIVCHLEFVDRWFDTCKAVGKVEVEIYRPGGGLNPGVDVRAGRWEIDLTNLERNAEWFDPVTRTYRLQLDLPAELERARGDAGKAAALRLRAIYTPMSGGGVIQDEFVLKG